MKAYTAATAILNNNMKDDTAATAILNNNMKDDTAATAILNNNLDIYIDSTAISVLHHEVSFCHKLSSAVMVGANHNGEKPVNFVYRQTLLAVTVGFRVCLSVFVLNYFTRTILFPHSPSPKH